MAKNPGFTPLQFDELMNAIQDGLTGGSYGGHVLGRNGGFYGIGSGSRESGTVDRYTGHYIKNFNKALDDYSKSIEKNVRDNARKRGWSKERTEREIQNAKKYDDEYQRLLKQRNNYVKEGNLLSGVTSFFKNALNIFKEYQNKEYELYRAQIQTTQKLTEEQINLSVESFNGSFSTVLNTLNGNVKEIGKNALSNQIKISKSFWEYERAVPLELRKLENQEIITDERFGLDLAKGITNFLTDVNAISYRNNVERQISQLLPEGIDVSAFSDISDQQIQMLREGQSIVDDINDIARDFVDMREKAMSMDTETREILNNIAGKIHDEVNGIVEKFSDLAQVTTNMLYEIDKSTKKLALQYGFTGEQAQAMTSAMIQSNLVAAKWALEAKDLLAIQEGYLDNAGRQVMMSDNDFDRVAATARITGLDTGQIGNVVGDMNVFNTSIEHGTDNIYTMYKLANKMGLSSKQFMKDLNSNLKLAQKYNFVGGTKAMEKMTIWSQQVRMNLATATGFAEQLIDGGIEKTLEKAANLQVLGGNAAIYSDPLGLMYDAGADMESLARRLEAMAGNFGTFDRTTGETKFSWTDTKMINEIAKALGMDRAEAMNILREKNKFSTVRDQFVGGVFTEEEQRAISNRATYDEKTGQFKVTLITPNGEKIDKNISELTASDYGNLLPQGEDALVDFAQKSLDVEMKQLAVTRDIAARIGVNTENDFYYTQAEKEGILRNNANSQVSLGTQTYRSIANMENMALGNDYEQMRVAWNSGLVGKAINFTSDQMTRNVERVTQLNAEFEQTTRLLVGDEKELYAAALKLAYLTGNDKLIERMMRAQTNKMDTDEGNPNSLQQWMGVTAPKSRESMSKAYSYDNYQGVQKFTSGGGHAFDKKLVSAVNATEVSMSRLTSAITALSSKPIQTNSSINMNGTLRVQQSEYGATNLINELQKNPSLMNEFVNLMAKQINANVNGGKSSGSQPGAPRKI